MQINEQNLSYYSQNKILPTGFSPCEYLESTGTQWIDTGWTATSVELSVKTSITRRSNTEKITGNYFGFNSELKDSDWFTLFNGTETSSITFWAGSSLGVQVFSESTFTGFHVVTVKTFANTGNNYLECTDNGTQSVYTQFSGSFLNNPGNFMLFTTGGLGHDTRPSAFRMKYLTLSQDSALVRNFLPALCLAVTTYIDGNTLQQVTATADKPGMYDTITGHFFVNQGTGADFLYKLK